MPKIPQKSQVLRINYRPHPAQALIHRSPARFKVISAGARFGKDRCCVNEFIKKCVEIGSEQRSSTLIPRVHAWIVAPTFGLAQQNWRELITFVPKELVSSVNKAERRMEWHDGCVIEVKSADDADSLLAVGLDVLLITEAARISEEAWLQALRPRLASPGRGPGGTGGLLLCNSTPKGKNWFYNAFLRGQDKQANPNWESWSFPTSSNPHIRPEEIEQARIDMPDRWFRQEFLAEFLEDSGGVFRGVRATMTGKLADPVAHHNYVMGVDWGKHADFTVLTMLDTTGSVAELVAWDRFNVVDYTIQLDRVKNMIQRYKPSVAIIEQNSIGDPLIDQLRRDLHEDTMIKPFTTTNQSKRHAVDYLTGLIERQEIVLADVPVLINEMEAYEYSMLPSGAVKYSAPSGMHDDAVMSLVFACWGARRMGSTFDDVKHVQKAFSNDDRVILPLDAFLGNERQDSSKIGYKKRPGDQSTPRTANWLRDTLRAF